MNYGYKYRSKYLFRDNLYLTSPIDVIIEQNFYNKKIFDAKNDKVQCTLINLIRMVDYIRQTLWVYFVKFSRKVVVYLDSQ